MKRKLFNPLTAFLMSGLLFAIPFLVFKSLGAFEIGLILSVVPTIRIGQILMAYYLAKTTQYCISEKSIYIQTGSDIGAKTITRPIEFFHTIEIEEVKYNLGNVICGYGENSGYEPYTLELLPDFQTAYDLIERIRHHQPLSGETEQKDPVLSEVPSFMDDTLIQRFPPPPSGGTPDDIFFGGTAQSYLRRKKRGKFLNPKSVSEYKFLDELPQESVADLQAELFGTDPELTGTFPDPTVNPLPELPEDQPQDDGFMQSGF